MSVDQRSCGLTSSWLYMYVSVSRLVMSRLRSKLRERPSQRLKMQKGALYMPVLMPTKLHRDERSSRPEGIWPHSAFATKASGRSHELPVHSGGAPLLPLTSCANVIETLYIAFGSRNLNFVEVRKNAP